MTQVCFWILLINILKIWTDFWGFGVSFDWLLYDSCGRSYRIRNARELLRVAQENCRLEAQVTKFDVSNTFYDLEQALYTYLSSNQGVDLAQESVAFAQESRDLGEISPIEYRESVGNLTRARLDFNRSQFALLRSYYNLYKVSGIHPCEMEP